jgi:hypothetical protein
MSQYHQRHEVKDGAFGVLHALFGMGTHHVDILNDKGQLMGRGTGSTEAAAREEAWKDLHRTETALKH